MLVALRPLPPSLDPSDFFTLCKALQAMYAFDLQCFACVAWGRQDHVNLLGEPPHFINVCTIKALPPPLDLYSRQIFFTLKKGIFFNPICS